MSRPFSLAGKLSLSLVAALVTMACVILLCSRLGAGPSLAVSIATVVSLPFGLYLVNRSVRPLIDVSEALRDGVRGFQAGDFSLRLADGGSDELGELVDVYNELASVMSEERSALRQRELILHSVLESSPLAVILVNAADRVIFANRTARTMFFSGGRLEGHTFAEIVAGCPDDLALAMNTRRDALATIDVGGDRDETFLVTRRQFDLNSRRHALILVRRMTQHLRRQEVAAWKKVIRMISHEINNSLAPIRSLLHSARLIRAKGGSAGSTDDRLDEIFEHIDESAAGLHRFVAGYAEFARLPEPRLERTRIVEFARRFARREQLDIEGDLDTLATIEVDIDPAQIEQVLVNLLKNAREAGSPPQEIALELALEGEPGARTLALHVRDRGAGMDTATIAKALVPFYSGKKDGTGLGLALSQEILEAHGGGIQLQPREGGGMKVTCRLPLQVLPA